MVMLDQLAYSLTCCLVLTMNGIFIDTNATINYSDLDELLGFLWI